jgi:hypothetical protein
LLLCSRPKSWQQHGMLLLLLLPTTTQQQERHSTQLHYQLQKERQELRLQQ